MGHGYVSLLKGNLSLDTIDVMSYCNFEHSAHQLSSKRDKV
jgi:hypothetical protein